MKIIKLLA